MTSSGDMSCFTLALVACLVHVCVSVDPKEVCYTGLGCFNNSAPFNNANGRVPAAPSDINVHQNLYTRNTRTNFESLSYSSTSSKTFDSSKLTKVVIHGFQNSATTKWVLDIKDALLNKGDFNVLVVGWGDGAHGMDYFAAAANTRLVAVEVRLLLQTLVSQAGLDLGDVHLIGHSLGAHISGYIGAQLGGKIGRISGMDPAQPSFEKQSTEVRLDKSDAIFVDVIHTDGNSTDVKQPGFGLMQESGHVDFYANGGAGHQPGCSNPLQGLLDILGKKRGLLDNLANQIACSHGRAHDIFLESIMSPCQFTGFSCTSWDDFKAGKCLDCSKVSCSPAGYDASKDKGTGPRYFLTTAATPLCGKHYRVYLSVHDSVTSRTDGTMFVTLEGDAGLTQETRVTPENAQMSGNTVVNHVVLFDKDVGQVKSIKVKFVKDDGRHAQTRDEIWLSNVSIQQGRQPIRFTTCQGKYHLATGSTKSLPAQLVDSATPTSCFNPVVFA